MIEAARWAPAHADGVCSGGVRRGHLPVRARGLPGGVAADWPARRVRLAALLCRGSDDAVPGFDHRGPLLSTLRGLRSSAHWRSCRSARLTTSMPRGSSRSGASSLLAEHRHLHPLCVATDRTRRLANADAWNHRSTLTLWRENMKTTDCPNRHCGADPDRLRLQAPFRPPMSKSRRVGRSHQPVPAARGPRAQPRRHRQGRSEVRAGYADEGDRSAQTTSIQATPELINDPRRSRNSSGRRAS